VVPPSGSGDHRAGDDVLERDERPRERCVGEEREIPFQMKGFNVKEQTYTQ
jgi:hypothetical protein